MLPVPRPGPAAIAGSPGTGKKRAGVDHVELAQARAQRRVVDDACFGDREHLPGTLTGEHVESRLARVRLTRGRLARPVLAAGRDVPQL